MAFGTTRTPPCKTGHTRRIIFINLLMQFMFIVAIVFAPMSVANGEGVLDASTEASAALVAGAAEAVETEVAAAPHSPNAPPEQAQPGDATVEDLSRERSSLDAVYNASVAQRNASQQALREQAGVTRRTALLAALAVLLSIGIFVHKAKVGFLQRMSPADISASHT